VSSARSARPSPSAARARAIIRSRGAVAFLALGLAGCAGRWTVPDPTAVAAAAATTSYSSRLRISLDGPTLRARTPVLLAFRRPDALRIEVPGPAGPRLVAVASGDKLWAVFPGERAFFSGRATEADIEALLGVALEPREVMDLLVGRPAPRLRAYEALWRGPLPARITAILPDGGRLRVTVDEAEAGAAIPEQAFAEPPHAAYRTIAAGEARRLWGGR
jgi:hypothetical protein